MIRRTHPSSTGADPMEETFSRISAVYTGGMDLSARLGRPLEAGWIGVEALAGDDRLLDELLGRVGRVYATEDRAVMGTLFLRNYLWRILISTVAAFLTSRRLPDLAAENVALSFDERGNATGLAFTGPRFAALEEDPFAGAPGAVALAGEDEMLAWMGERLAGVHLSELFSALRRCGVRRAARANWSVASDVIAESFVWIGREMGQEERGRTLAEKALGCGPRQLRGRNDYLLMRQDGGTTAVRTRNICCLYYRVADEPCLTCPRLTDEERRKRLVR
jgi:hypothetical protein